MTTKEFKRLQQFLSEAIEKGIADFKGSVIPFNSEEIQRCYIHESPQCTCFTPETMLVNENICNIPYKHVQKIQLRVVFKDNTIRSFHRRKGGYYD